MSQAPVESDASLFGDRTSLPYDGTTGHAREGASAQRAHREAADGTAADRQNRIIALLSDAGPIGMTADELARRNVAPHRSAVSAHTSSLHKAGRIACLRERRDGAGIYVLPQNVNGRVTREFAGRTDADVAAQDASEISADTQAEIERLRLENERLTGVAAATDPDVAHAAALATLEANRPRLSAQERTLVDNVENGLPRLRNKGIVALRWESAQMLVAALRRLDGQD
jgi:hypothetical protein